MAEPASTATATIAAGSVAMPALVAFGVSLGLRPELLLAGFCGAIAAIALLDTVPSDGDTWRELVRTSMRRVFVCIASAMVAGFITPLVALLGAVPASALLSVAFVTGAGAPQLLRALITRFKRGVKGDKAERDQT